MREFVALPLVVACFIATIMCSRQDDWERVMDEDPAWSPDGDQIAFVRRDSTGCGLYLVDSSGRNERLLLEGDWTSPSWSPDGRWLIFSVGYGGVIHKVTTDGDSMTQLTFEGSSFYPDWSVRNRIAYDSNENDPQGAHVLWLMDPDGSNRKDIGEHGVGEQRCPSWSPDGSRIVFYRGYVGGYPGWDLAIVDSSGEDLRRLTDDSFDYRRPRWSPDGAVVVVSRREDSGWTLRILDLDTQLWSLLSTPRDALDPTWSPDGRRICFSLRRYRDLGWETVEESAELWVIDRDGNNLRQLTRRH